jgi:formate hydrogenlyase transcriptional activator
MAGPDQEVRGLNAPDQLRFEMLLTDITTRFLGMEPREVDAGVDGTLDEIRRFFDSNMCALFRFNPDADEAFLTHLAVSADIPVMPEKINYAPLAPWLYARALRGETSLVDFCKDAPPGADVDRQTALSLGIHSVLFIPVMIGGITHYALQLLFTREGPPRLADYTPRLQVLAEVLVTVLERSRAVVAREAVEARLEQAAGLAGAGLWDLDLTAGTIWATAQTRELYGVGETEPISLETLYGIVHPEDVEGLKLELEKALQSGTGLQVEYRIVLRGGGVRWLAVRGARSPQSFGGGDHFLGISMDVTERKNLEEGARRSHEEISRLNELLEIETRYLRREAGLSQSHKEIVGKSVAIRSILRFAEQVAPADTAVLIAGETGTGKELVARAIHSMSGRKERLMVKVDCASLPSTLIESELFGRERGAYTGAMTRQIGRFQLADKGTIFLDEIGELPRETQVKLLRVLEDGTFQALGDPRTVQVDVRVIAATNRDLAKEVSEGRFREDLYYRLNVFPIVVPPLRERKEDIPMLVWSFVEKFSREMRKEIRRIPKETMDALVSYQWPGNVRELKNLIEQAFILSPGDVLDVRLPVSPRTGAIGSQTLEEAERRHILQILEQTLWRIKGQGGAASRLGLNPSSLYSRMKKLGIPTKRNKGDMTP